MSKHDVPKNRLFIVEDDLENLYPEDLLVQVISDTFGGAVSQDELKKNGQKGKRKKFLSEKLKSPLRWNVTLAGAIGSSIDDGQFDPDLLEFLQKIHNELSLGSLQG